MYIFTKRVSTLNGLIIIIAEILIVFGGVFAYQYYFVPKNIDATEVPAINISKPAK